MNYYELLKFIHFDKNSHQLNKYQSEKHNQNTIMTNKTKRESEATPATSRLRVEISRYNHSSEKRKTKQQKHTIEARRRRNNQSPEKQNTENEKHAIQKKKRQESCKKNRGRKISCEEEKAGNEWSNRGKLRKGNMSRKTQTTT